MTEQKKIGVVTEVNSGALVVMMDDTLGSLKKELNGKVYYLGQMGSYVLIPVGKVIVVAMVSELKKLDVSINGEWKQRVLFTFPLWWEPSKREGTSEEFPSFPRLTPPCFLPRSRIFQLSFPSFRNLDFRLDNCRCSKKNGPFWIRTVSSANTLRS